MKGIYNQHDGQKEGLGSNRKGFDAHARAKIEFSLNKLVAAELKILSGSAIPPVQNLVHGRPNIKFGLHIGDVGESDIYTVGKGEFLRKELVGNQDPTSGQDWHSLPKSHSAWDWV